MSHNTRANTVWFVHFFSRHVNYSGFHTHPTNIRAWAEGQQDIRENTDPVLRDAPAPELKVVLDKSVAKRIVQLYHRSKTNDEGSPTTAEPIENLMTNQLTSFATTTLFMSTREIAELTGKRHNNVIADFRDMCEALEIGELKFQSSYLSEQNKPTLMYELPKDLTTTLVSGYSIPMRHKIVQRWMELEAVKPTIAIPTTLVEALRLALEGAEKLEAALVQVETMKPGFATKMSGPSSRFATGPSPLGPPSASQGCVREGRVASVLRGSSLRSVLSPATQSTSCDL